jgi:hypothetical protein
MKHFRRTLIAAMVLGVLTLGPLVSAQKPKDPPPPKDPPKIVVQPKPTPAPTPKKP